MSKLIRNNVLTILHNLFRDRNKPLHAGLIHDVYVLKYGKVSPETVPRTLRKLREEGFAMGEYGYYQPVKKR